MHTRWRLLVALLGMAFIAGASAGQRTGAGQPRAVLDDIPRPSVSRAARFPRKPALAATGGSRSPSAGIDLDNGVIRIRMIDHAPIVTSMWVMGIQAVPHDNVGADLQMAARSTKGDGYNPTQGGDCRGNPSVLRRYVEDWNALDPGIPARFGVLLHIDPRNYNEPSYPGCLGAGAILPYDMRFGITLGDGISMPRELMILEMSIGKKPGSAAEDIVKGLSELPVAYLDNATFRYAYYSVDGNPADGQAFQPMRVASPSGETNDTRLWPNLTNYPVGQPARVIMLCNRADAELRPDQGLCVALYSHEAATMQASHRLGAIYNLTSITAIIADDINPLITDYELHTQRRLLAVGSPDTIAAAIAWAETRLRAQDWSRW